MRCVYPQVMEFADATTPDARARLLGERLAEQRLALNLPQSEAASRAGVSRDAVQRSEKGRGTVDTLLRLLAAYGIADRLDLLLPEPEVGPAQLLAASRPGPRKRARSSGARAGQAPPVWDETP